MPMTASEAGAVVTVSAGAHRGRWGVTCGKPDGTNSIRVRFSGRSAYDAGRPHDFAWVPVEFLTVRGIAS